MDEPRAVVRAAYVLVRLEPWVAQPERVRLARTARWEGVVVGGGVGMGMGITSEQCCWMLADAFSVRDYRGL